MIKKLTISGFVIISGLLISITAYSQSTYYELTAKVTDLSGGPVVGKTAYLSSIGPADIFSVATTDSTGIAAFKVKSHISQRDVIIQMREPADSIYTIKYLGLTGASLVDSIVADAGNYDTLPFFGTQVTSYQVDNYVKFTTMEDVLREYVTPVGVRNRRGQVYPFVFDVLRRLPFDTDPLLLVNGVPVLESQRLMNMNPMRVKLLSVVDCRYFFAGEIFHGIISVTTNDYSIDDIYLSKGALLVKRQN